VGFIRHQTLHVLHNIRYMFRLVLNIFSLVSVKRYLGLDPTFVIEWYIGVFSIQQGVREVLNPGCARDSPMQPDGIATLGRC
jgi:hypothetical protein